VTSESPGLRWRSLRTSPSRDAGVADGGSSTQCPDLAVSIPGGAFVMGSPEGEGPPDEHPSRQVTVGAFCLDRTEVTIDAYMACVAAGACSPTSATQTSGDVPVSGIDWQQAFAMCRFVGGRLPTEAEWEFAARGTDGRRFPWGNEAPTDCDRADWTPDGTSQSCQGVGPSSVTARPRGASPFGALDMAGNVWEWTADWYAPTYPPGVARDPTGPDEGSARVTRGGGWNNDQTDRLRATWREGQHPAFHDYDLGVRCAYDRAP
jgi:formylglycine-generating enzyme required for sulfatase activity